MTAALTSTPFKFGAFAAVSSVFGAGVAAIALTYAPPPDPFGGAPVFEVQLIRDAKMSEPAAPTSANMRSLSEIPPTKQSSTRPKSQTRKLDAAITPHVTRAAEPATVMTRHVEMASPSASLQPPLQSASHSPATTAPPRSRAASDDRSGAPTQGAQGGPRDDIYEAQVIRWIDQHKRHPGRLEGIVTLRFEVDRRGRIRDCIITRTSGDPRLDRIAQQQLKEAAPLPRPPSDTTWQTREISVSLDFRSYT